MKTPEPFEGSCPYCKFGLTPAVKALYERFSFDPDDMNYSYGPGHVVFADENYDDESIRFCLNAARESDHEYAEEAEKILAELLAIPESERAWDDAEGVE